RRALTERDGQLAIVLAPAALSKSGGPILLTQRDVREVQLAKAAVRAGIEVIAGEFGIAPQEAAQMLVAGGFGNFIRRSCAIRIGLLPPIAHERIEFIGNAASAGARAALACCDCRAEAERISRCTEYVELAARPDFQAAYMNAIPFPPGN
ncbi:MAG: ASKHA domain-containing protein, partial [Planctomycetota bacterium]